MRWISRPIWSFLEQQLPPAHASGSYKKLQCLRHKLGRCHLATRAWSTSLAKGLGEAIETTGPIPIASFMRQCLTSPQGGYYSSRQTLTSNQRDQFGRQGDFVTSPEISSIFGELVGIWLVAEWMAQGRRKGNVRLVELGPGRGTLMDDILRTIARFKAMASSIESIHMVEASHALSEAQKELLCGDVPFEECATGRMAHTTKHLPEVQAVWMEDFRFVPPDTTKQTFIIAHEFFDALPIHAFQSVVTTKKPVDVKEPPKLSTSHSRASQLPVIAGNAPDSTNLEWRELLVTTTPSRKQLYTSSSPLETHEDRTSIEFQLTLAGHSTRHSELLPQISQRYQNLLDRQGSCIEISPEARIASAAVANMIGQVPESGGTAPGGAALVIDYGTSSTIPVNTLRGIKSHKLVSPFSTPGETDISADVDFAALAEAAVQACEHVEVHGPVEQAFWLKALGGEERTAALKRRAEQSGDLDMVHAIDKSWSRLVDTGPNGMGKLYKMMAIIPEGRGARKPIGFGGDVKG